MAEAIGLASGLITLLGTAYNSCQTLHNAISAIRSAPKHIHSIKNDLNDIRLVLGTLQALVDDEDTFAGVAHHATLENLSKVLENCVSIFISISAIVSKYALRDRSTDVGTWQCVKWTFKEKEIQALRTDLTNHKITLNVAISVANLYNTISANTSASRIEAEIATHVQHLEDKLPKILLQIEDVKASQLPTASEHSTMDRLSVRVDRDYALRHYLDSAASIVSGPATPASASLQVSDLVTSDSAITSIYQTAQSNLTSKSSLRPMSEYAFQIFIEGALDTKSRTIILQVEPKHAIAEVKALVRKVANLPYTAFKLCYVKYKFDYSRQVLAEELALEEYNIPHLSTLECVSFEQHLWSIPIDHVRITDSDETVVHIIDVDADDLVCNVVARYAKRRSLNPHAVKLTYAGSTLNDETAMVVRNFGTSCPMLTASLKAESSATYKPDWTMKENRASL